MMPEARRRQQGRLPLARIGLPAHAMRAASATARDAVNRRRSFLFTEAVDNRAESRL